MQVPHPSGAESIHAPQLPAKCCGEALGGARASSSSGQQLEHSPARRGRSIVIGHHSKRPVNQPTAVFHFDFFRSFI
jgi:hypothetical protein